MKDKIQYHKMKKSGWTKYIIYAAAVAAIYIVLELLVNSGFLGYQYKSLLIPVGINVILAVSLNITTGFLGELSLGHAGFYAIGAYTGALITTNVTGLPDAVTFAIAIIAGGIMAAIFGVIIGIPVLRLKGDYLAIVTLASTEIIRSLLNGFADVTGGPSGISKIPKYSSFTLVFVFCLITILASANLLKSRHGRAICSIRENYIAAEAMGIPVTRYKILAFCIAAFFAGIAGVLYAHNNNIIKPTHFDYNVSINILVFVVLGGMGSIKGSVIAAILLTVLPEVLRFANDYRKLFYALALIVMMIVNSGDIKEKFADKKFFSRKKKEVA